MHSFLITGGAGFIGSNLTKELLKENKVIIIDNFCDYYDPKIKEKNIENYLNNKNYKLYRGDIRDKEILKKIFDENNIECVIHLAAMAGVRKSIENPSIFVEVNCLGTQNLLEEMKIHNVKNLVMSSSSSVYGNCKYVPFKENMIVDYPISPYAATKKSNELMTNVYHELYDMNVIVLRFFTVYGPRQRPDLAISKFTKLILNNEEIPMYGNGETLRDYTYIDDIIDGIIKSIDYIQNRKCIYEIINLGSSNPITLKKMINTIGQILNKDPRIKELSMQIGDVERTYADISKAKKLLGYEPKTTFIDGVIKYIEWLKNINE